MQKQKIKKLLAYRKTASTAGIALLLAFGIILSGLVGADQFDDQIRELQNQNSGLQQRSGSLAAEAASYQDAINKLQIEINGIHQAILDNQRKNDELQRQIDATQAELTHQKYILGQNIKTMYLEGQISTLEILASSNDLSEFVDKQAYRNSVQRKVKTTLEKITQIKVELESQQRQVQIIINEQEAQKAQLASSQDEQSRMLAYTESQKASFDSQIKANQTQISELRRQQAATNARLFGGGQIIQTSRCDIYPQDWCNAPMDSIIDSWGMYNRECVSWTAYRVAASGRYMPYWGGRGNANQWDDNALAAGIPVDGNPQVGDVAVSNAGYYGHTAYVEAVYDDGTILVSQFNVDWQGTYSMARIRVGNLVFIHFP
ncbi:hypothetical protein A3F65_00285 [Candidatus Saccharibacteria bacterium RIFCSPHIGHO2_12_FULL_47_16b]|nr:MAG: hypothetical protein A3F65_00285 [Candidatus Saccharibacteria bacterium RIFCSPHIGHO2_12_FULL_47_16b]